MTASIPHKTQSGSLDHLELVWLDMCLPLSALWAQPGPPPWFSEEELQLSWLRQGNIFFKNSISF